MADSGGTLRDRSQSGQVTGSQSQSDTPQSRVIRFDTDPASVPSTSGNQGLRARRHTPYQKTPKSRQLPGSRSRLVRTPTNAQTDRANSVLPDLVNKTWRVYKVTPMYKFNSSKTALKHYCRHLSAHIEAESMKGVAVCVEGHSANKAVITPAVGLQASPDDSESIVITFKQEKGRGRAKDTQVVLTAVLCSVNIDSTCKQKLDASFTWLPIMLVKGPVSLTNHLVSWLQMEFDCNICAMKFSSYDLCWMVAMWTGSVTDTEKSKWVELYYKVPAQCEGLSSITYTIHPADCKALWDRIHDKNSEEFSGEEVTRFIKGLEQHFYNHFKVYLSAMYLTRIGTSAVFAGAEGRLKIFSQAGVLGILSHLTTLSTEQINVFMP